MNKAVEDLIFSESNQISQYISKKKTDFPTLESKIPLLYQAILSLKFELALFIIHENNLNIVSNGLGLELAPYSEMSILEHVLSVLYPQFMYIDVPKDLSYYCPNEFEGVTEFFRLGNTQNPQGVMQILDKLNKPMWNNVLALALADDKKDKVKSRGTQGRVSFDKKDSKNQEYNEDDIEEVLRNRPAHRFLKSPPIDKMSKNFKNEDSDDSENELSKIENFGEGEYFDISNELGIDSLPKPLRLWPR